MNATEALQKAQQLLDQRGRDYDHEGGERSMAAAVTALNALTGHKLTEGDGWLLLDLVKTVRSKHSPGHLDSNIDKVAYAALRAEAECAHIAQGSRCVSETGSEDIGESQDESARSEHDSEGCGIYEVRQAHPVGAIPEPKYHCPECGEQWTGENTPLPCKPDIGIPTSEQNQSVSDDEGWIEHDGSDRCPVTDGDIQVEVVCSGIVHKACSVSWGSVDRWRVAEVDGWVRNVGRSSMPPVGSGSGAAQRVRVAYRGGMVSKPHYATNLVWRHEGGADDIIAYRVEKDGA